MPVKAKHPKWLPSTLNGVMYMAISNKFVARDRIRYALTRVDQTEVSWSARELFFLVKMFFPAETRSSINEATTALCSSGEFLISGRRYERKALKPVKTEGAAVVHLR